MRCPACDQPVKDNAPQCPHCDEVLTQWTALARHGSSLRNRGRVFAAQQDYFRACLSFMQAALIDPFDETSILEAAKALFHLGHREDALGWLRLAEARGGKGAAAIAEAIKALEQARTAAGASPATPEEETPAEKA